MPETFSSSDTKNVFPDFHLHAKNRRWVPVGISFCCDTNYHFVATQITILLRHKLPLCCDTNSKTARFLVLRRGWKSRQFWTQLKRNLQYLPSFSLGQRKPEGTARENAKFRLEVCPLRREKIAEVLLSGRPVLQCSNCTYAWSWYKNLFEHLGNLCHTARNILENTSF